mgnify:CR=1 FL=1
MIELIVYNQRDHDQVTLDVSNPGAISLTYNVGSVGDVLGRMSPFSQTFRLPFTAKNSQFFQHYYDVNMSTGDVGTSRFVPEEKIECELRQDGIPIIIGTLQLRTAHITAEEYEVVVYGLEAGFFQAIGDKKLIDLFNTAGVLDPDYDVVLTEQNIWDSFVLSNDVTSGTVGAGVVVFPVIDYGQVGTYNFLYYEDNAVYDAGLREPHFIEPHNFKPSISISHLFNKVVDQAGYTLTNNAFITSNEWSKLYMTLGGDRATMATISLHQIQAANTTAATINTWSSNPGDTSSGISIQIPFNDVTGAGYNNNPASLYDIDNNWDIVNNVFVAPYNGTYTGELHVVWDTGNANAADGSSVRISVAGAAGEFAWTFADLEGNSGAGALLTAQVLPFSAGLIAGQTLECRARATITTGLGTDLKAEGTYVTITGSSGNSGIASIPHNMPDISQVDFITDLAQRFNLCVVSDKDNPKRLDIQPWQDFLNVGVRKDWTQKLDLSQPRQLSPTDKLKKRFIKFSDAEGKDNRNVQNQETYGKVFGEFSQEIKSEWASGTLENKSIFAPFHVNPIPRQDNSNTSDIPTFVIHQDYAHGTTGPISDAKPKLFYHNDYKLLPSGTPPWYIGETGGTRFPLCLPFYNDGDPMASDSPLLYWQFQTPISWGNPIYGNLPSSGGYFAKYWQQFLLTIYSQEARQLEASFFLTASDILNFKFNDEIVVENCIYRIIKISNYQPFAGVPTKVTLLKKVDRAFALRLPPPDVECELTPASYLEDGTVLFKNPVTGATSSGTEDCCNEYGYFWDGNDCYWEYGGGGGGGGDPTTGVGSGQKGPPTYDTISGVHDLKGVGGFTTRKSNNVRNINPVTGEHSTKGINVGSVSSSVAKNFVFYATTNSDTVITATPNGKAEESGRIHIPFNSSARLVIRALSIQTDEYTGTSGSYGSSSFNVWTFLVKNVSGTITVNASGGQQTDFQQADADAGTRTIDVTGVEGKTGFAGTRGVTIECTGPADSVCAWHLDCDVTYFDFAFTESLHDNLFTESMANMLTENKDYIQEEV